MSGGLPLLVAIPAHGESQWLPHTMASLAQQSHSAFEVWIHINQSRSSLADQSEGSITHNNRACLDWLQRSSFDFSVRVLDTAHPDLAPADALAGVGWARRTLYDAMIEARPDCSIIVSIDADTQLDADYLATVMATFDRYPNAGGLAAPYFHRVPDDPELARAILRYEIYLRYYQVSLWRIASPYAYLPMGSAMAFRPTAYIRAGRMPRKKAAEDFYFLQNMRKNGPLIRWIPSRVYPATRVSDRVPFGTGKAILNRHSLDEKYPFFAQSTFDDVAHTYGLFPALYDGPHATPMDEFLERRLRGVAVFDRIRNHVRDRAQFIKACHEHIDALRILQFLRSQHRSNDPARDITLLLDRVAPMTGADGFDTPIDFESLPIGKLDALRHCLLQHETAFQRAYMERWDDSRRW